MEVYYDDKEYQAELRRVSVEGFSDTEQLMELPKEKEYFIAVYLQDVTELNRTIRENEEQRMVAGLVYIDNYDEVIDSVEEVRQSLLMALVDRKINQYIAKVDGIVKKLENDKYFIIIRKSYFKQLEEDKFSLLDDVKSVNIGNGIPATLSIGLGLSSDSYAQSYNYARVAIRSRTCKRRRPGCDQGLSRCYLLWWKARTDSEEYPCKGACKSRGTA